MRATSATGLVFLATSPYFALRLAVSFLLELIGLSLVWAIRAVSFMGLTAYRAIMKIGSVFGSNNCLQKFSANRRTIQPTAQAKDFIAR